VSGCFFLNAAYIVQCVLRWCASQFFNGNNTSDKFMMEISKLWFGQEQEGILP